VRPIEDRRKRTLFLVFKQLLLESGSRDPWAESARIAPAGDGNVELDRSIRFIHGE